MPQTECPSNCRYWRAAIRGDRPQIGVTPTRAKGYSTGPAPRPMVAPQHYDAARGATSTYLFRVVRNESEQIIAHRTAQCRDYRKCVAFKSCVPQQIRSPVKVLSGARSKLLFGWT